MLSVTSPILNSHYHILHIFSTIYDLVGRFVSLLIKESLIGNAQQNDGIDITNI